MRTLNTLVRAMDTMEAVLAKPLYPVDGFAFILDDPDLFDPFSVESMQSVNMFEPDAPAPEGFVYASEAYVDYVAALIDSDQNHPHNVLSLPWTHLGLYETQHHTTPSQKEYLCNAIDH